MHVELAGFRPEHAVGADPAGRDQQVAMKISIVSVF
jgi:hypothetical protein